MKTRRQNKTLNSNPMNLNETSTIDTGASGVQSSAEQSPHPANAEDQRTGGEFTKKLSAKKRALNNKQFKATYQDTIEDYKCTQIKRLFRQAFPTNITKEKSSEKKSDIQPTKSARVVELENQLMQPDDFSSSLSNLHKRQKVESIKKEVQLLTQGEVQVQSNQNQIQCQQCLAEQGTAVIFSNKSKLFDHIAKEHHIQKCRKCEKTHRTRDLARKCCSEVKRLVHIKTCEACGNNFRNRQELNQHLMEGQNRKCGLYCEIDGCRKHFYSIKELEAHRTQHHTSSQSQVVRFKHFCNSNAKLNLSNQEALELDDIKQREDFSKSNTSMQADYYPPVQDHFVMLKNSKMSGSIDYTIIDGHAGRIAFILAIRSVDSQIDQILQLVEQFKKEIQRRRVTKVYIEYQKNYRGIFRKLGFFKPLDIIELSEERLNKSHDKGLELGSRILDNFIRDSNPIMQIDESVPKSQLGKQIKELIEKLKTNGFLDELKRKHRQNLNKYLASKKTQKIKDSWMTPQQVWDWIYERVGVDQSFSRDLTPLKREFDRDIDWDFMTNDWFDCVNESNPPFSLATECLIKSLIEFIENERTVVLLMPEYNTDSQFMQDTVCSIGQRQVIPAFAFCGAYANFGYNLSMVLLKSPRLIDYSEWMKNKHKWPMEMQERVKQQSFKKKFDNHSEKVEKACMMHYEGYRQRAIEHHTALSECEVIEVVKTKYPGWLQLQ